MPEEIQRPWSTQTDRLLPHQYFARNPILDAELLEVHVAGVTIDLGNVPGEYLTLDFDQDLLSDTEFAAAGGIRCAGINGRRLRLGRSEGIGDSYPVRYPFIDLAEVSGGGGTLARVSREGRLQVGPLSAGADPGPASYGRGGEQPTVTDAGLMLGWLSQRGLSGGSVALCRDRAEEAIRSRIAAPLGLSVVQAARGIIDKPRIERAPFSSAKSSSAALIERRVLFFDPASPVETPVYSRAQLLPGNRISGPAVVEQADSTSIVPPGWIRNILRDLQERGSSPKPGDVLICNNPYVAGTHLNDVTLVKPVFLGDVLVGYSANKAHHADIGGLYPGSISSRATTLADEGAIIDPTRLLKQGRLNRALICRLEESVRTPEICKGDLRAQLSGVNTGERRMLELAARHGWGELSACFQEIMRHGEERMRRRIEAVPSGRWAARDCLEDLIGPGTLSWLEATVSVSGSGMTVDFQGTCAEVDMPLNAVLGVTLSSVCFAVKSVLDPEGEVNEGTLRPIQVIAPSGSLLNPVFPAPVAGGNLETAQRVADVVFLALSQALPSRVAAASCGSMNNVVAGGFFPLSSQEWVFYETIGGGTGARPGANGIDGIQCNMTNTMNTPIEAIERDYPIRFERYELRTGGAGRGRWTGGRGIERSWTLTGPSAAVTVLGERCRRPPWGLAGGDPGETARYFVRRPDQTIIDLSSKSTTILRQGDTLVVQTAGGGGYGPADSEQDRSDEDDAASNP